MDKTACQQFRHLVFLSEAERFALNDIAELLLPEIPAVVEEFYERLQYELDTVPFLEGKASALQKMYSRWIASLFSGTYSENFWDEQRQVGLRHTQFGIPHALFLAGFAIIRDLLIGRIRIVAPDSTLALLAISKLLDLCQYHGGGAYVRQTEHIAVQSLRKLSQIFSPEAFFRESALLACQLVKADGAALILCENDTLHYAFFEGLPVSYRELANHTFAKHEGVAGAALAQGQPVYVSDYSHSPYAMSSFVASGLRASLALPLWGPEGALGVLVVSWFETRAPNRLPENNWDYLRLLSDMLAGILHRAQLETRLESLATRDMLTDLPNRRALPERMAGAMARADRHNSFMTLLFIDLDGFKPINDHFGHVAGDHTLRAVAESLRSTVRKGDTVIRYAGDEFLVILEEPGYMAEIEAVIGRVLQAVRRDVIQDDVVFSLSASIGVTVYPFDEFSPEMLIHHADVAMYQAKKAGGNAWRLYEGESKLESDADRGQLLREFQRAVDQHEFCLFWQPIVDLNTLQITGAEALLRWQHPQKGLLVPAVFLDALECSPYMQIVGHWVLETALRQAEQWHQSGRCWDVHINLAAAQLEKADFSRYIESVLSQFPRLHYNAVWLEIVERVALDDVMTMAAMIRSCRDLGIHFTLDDFGTGAAAIQYLAELECSGLKIDKSLITPIRDGGKHHKMVCALIDMAAALSIDIVAEGVEDAETADHLRTLGVARAQGYHFSQPIPANDLDNLVIQSRSRIGLEC